MLASFKDSFIKKPLFSGAPSDALIEALSMELPQGCAYEYSGMDDVCYITAQGKMKIEDLQIQLPEEIREVLAQKSDYSQQMALLFQYQYNLQKPLEVTIPEDAKMTFENGSVPLDKALISPMHRVEIDKGKLVMMPEMTEQRRRLALSDGQHQLEIYVERKPSGIWNEDLYVSVDNSPLTVRIKLKEMEKRVSLNVTVNMQSSMTVKQRVESLCIYNAFQLGKARIDDVEFTETPDIKNLIPDSTINYWKNLASLEERIAQRFTLPAQIEDEDLILGGKLICSVIKDKPFKTYKSIDSLSFIGSKEECTRMRSYIESQPIIGFWESGKCELFGATFPIYTCVIVQGGIVSDVTEVSETECIVHFSPSSTSKAYSSEKYFLEEDAAKAFMKSAQFIKQMLQASTLRESLEGEE